MLIGCVREWSKEQEQEVLVRKGENKDTYKRLLEWRIKDNMQCQWQCLVGEDMMYVDNVLLEHV